MHICNYTWIGCPSQYTTRTRWTSDVNESHFNLEHSRTFDVARGGLHGREKRSTTLKTLNNKTEDQVTLLVTNPGFRLVAANILVSHPRVRVVTFGTFTSDQMLIAFVHAKLHLEISDVPKRLMSGVCKWCICRSRWRKWFCNYTWNIAEAQ